MKIFHVDAFTNEPFKGNPAGVCIIEENDIGDDLKIKIACELRHSETAFLLGGKDGYRLRWFSPEREVDLCGHATLATAHILWETGIENRETVIRFETRSGELTAVRRGTAIELDFPRLQMVPCEDQEAVNAGLGIVPVRTLKSDRRYLVEVKDPGVLRSIVPDFATLARSDRGAFIVTCRSDRPGYDFLSRYFAPYAGVPEDPVTGSAHCCLAPYWAEKLGKTLLKGYQESKRTGTIECELADGDRVKLRGNAVTISAGEILLDRNPVHPLY